MSDTAFLARLRKDELIALLEGQVFCTADLRQRALAIRRRSLVQQAEAAWAEYLRLTAQRKAEYPAGLPGSLAHPRDFVDYLTLADLATAAADRCFALYDRAASPTETL